MRKASKNALKIASKNCTCRFLMAHSASPPGLCAGPVSGCLSRPGPRGPPHVAFGGRLTKVPETCRPLRVSLCFVNEDRGLVSPRFRAAIWRPRPRVPCAPFRWQPPRSPLAEAALRQEPLWSRPDLLVRDSSRSRLSAVRTFVHPQLVTWLLAFHPGGKLGQSRPELISRRNLQRPGRG